MKLVDYGSDSESDGGDSDGGEKTEIQPKALEKSAPVSVQIRETKPQVDGDDAEEEGQKKKKITLKYKDLPKFLNPKIHKADKKDGWNPKTLAEIDAERKRRMTDLSESNDKKAKLTKLMRLPSPKNVMQNDAVTSLSSRQRAEIKPVMPSNLNVDTFFNEDLDESLINQFDQEDLFISKRHQKVMDQDHEALLEGNRKYAKSREATEQEQEMLGTFDKDKNIKMQEISRDQIIGDSNWLLNHQKQQQQSILRQGYQLSEPADKTQKSKNQLNFLAAEAINNQDHLDQQRAEQIRNTKIKRQRLGW